MLQLNPSFVKKEGLPVNYTNGIWVFSYKAYVVDSLHLIKGVSRSFDIMISY